MLQNHTFLCKSANGKNIVFDPVHSHTATHFNDDPSLQETTVELLSTMHLEGDTIGKDVELGRIVGDSNVVETTEADEIVYAMRKNREDQGYVPFTKCQSPKPSSCISIYLNRIDSDTYELSSAWVGEYDSPNFPQMENATAESEPYWRVHAFVWGSQEIIPGTVVSECPW